MNKWYPESIIYICNLVTNCNLVTVLDFSAVAAMPFNLGGKFSKVIQIRSSYKMKIPDYTQLNHTFGSTNIHFAELNL